MRHRHGRAEQVAAGTDCLADRVTPVKHHLEVDLGDRGARRAQEIARGNGSCPAVNESSIHGLELLENPVALAIEPCGGRRGEDRIALELDDLEVGLHAIADSTRHSCVASCRRSK